MPLVTDPDLIKQLEGGGNVVTDPELLKQLESGAAPQPERSIFGRAATALGAPDPNAPPDAGGINATVGRVATGIVGGIPDLAIKMQNAGLNPFDMVGAGVDRLLGTTTPTPKIPEVTPLLRQATGTPELPADASGARRFLESAAQVAGAGGSQAVGRAIQAAPTAAAAVLPAISATTRNIAAPIVFSELGGQYGEKVGGEKGQVLGSLLGGLVGNMPGPAAAVERYYGRQARPNAPEIAAAAERQGVTPTAGMLGNEKIQDIERAITGRGTVPGLGNPAVSAREQALVQMREQADRAAAARGAQHPAPTSGAIGEHVLSTAEQSAQNLREQSSTGQQQMIDRVGQHAPVDVSGIYGALRTEIQRTDPGTARPMQQRLQQLEEMMPRDRTGRVVIGPSGEIQIPYQRIKDWRSNLGRGTQVQEPVAAGHLDQIYGAVTDAMRETAARHGVSPAEFDAVQAQTRSLIGSGGPVSALEKIAGREGTAGRVGALPPERAFNKVIDEQNPHGLQLLEQHAPPQDLSRIAGDTLRLRAQETLGQGGTGGTGAPIEGVRGGGAAGARKFANWWANMSPEAQRILGGNQAPTMNDLAELSGAFNYPTRQTGLTRAIGHQLGGLGGRMAIAGVLGEGSKALGLGRTPGWGLGYFGVSPLVNYLHGRLLESGAARRGMSGNYSSTPSPTLADLIAQLTAANQGAR